MHSVMPRPRLPISENQEGPHVRATQRICVLLECEFSGSIPPVVLSGRFRSTTEMWVKELQKEFGLPQDGKVDQKIIRALDREARIDFWKVLEFIKRRADRRGKKDDVYSLIVLPGDHGEPLPAAREAEK